MMDLDSLLREVFGFASFRKYQKEVCAAAAGGQDLLLVMPTGAGKSLCYQLPGLARGKTTLVVSPLVALMEDQVEKLKALQKVRAERIHSGLGREHSRQVCADYLRGELDFLFLAPERLAVPGFVEMLAKRPLSLIAVDEAHCISQWGHDFRPEYRMLGARLPELRPAPVVALTATATPRVQEDILKQLGLIKPKKFIHGFRRENLSLEVLEVNPSGRIQALERLFGSRDRLPAILYAPTRKRAEELAEELGKRFRAAAYHAGLKPDARARVQADFLADRYDMIIATIAFGMGVDKPNIRTVVHAALPGSVEAYYQEIGRAGRDGHPARAVLLYSYSDRRTHDFFYEQDYPEPAVLKRVFEALDAETPRPQDDVQSRAGIDADVFEKALDKLWVHGGVRIEASQELRRGRESWAESYVSQRDHKKAQLDQMLQFAEAPQCRMLRLVRYFGDEEDGGKPCGLCDVCRPEESRAGKFRRLDGDELLAAKKVLYELGAEPGQAVGTLYRNCVSESVWERRRFEELLGGLTRAGLVRLNLDSFVKDGKTIEFRRVSLTLDGQAALRNQLALLGEMVTLPERAAVVQKRASRRKSKSLPLDRAAMASERPEQPTASPELIEALKAWRLAEARAGKIPAFRILSDRVLHALAARKPRDEEELLGVSGIGPTLAAKYGGRILEILRRQT